MPRPKKHNENYPKSQKQVDEKDLTNAKETKKVIDEDVNFHCEACSQEFQKSVKSVDISPVAVSHDEVVKDQLKDLNKNVLPSFFGEKGNETSNVGSRVLKKPEKIEIKMPPAGPISQYENPLENYDDLKIINGRINRMDFEELRNACKSLHLNYGQHKGNGKMKRALKAHYNKKFAPLPGISPIIVSHEEVIEQLKDVEDLEKQMISLVQVLELTDQDVIDRVKMINEVEKSVTEILGQAVSVEMFGSVVSGLGFKGCDVDVVVTGLNELHEFEHGIATETVPPSEQKSSVRKIVSKLQKVQPDFVNIIGILNTRVPIVKFSSARTGISCDISFRNR